MVSQGHTGAYVYSAYQDESTFLTQPGSLTRVFGLNTKFSNVQIKENLIKLPQLYRPTIGNFAWGKFEGSCNVEFDLSNPWWLSLFFAAPHTTGAGPYTHTYPDDRVDSGNIPRAVTSLSLELGDIQPASNVIRDFNGCILNELTLSSRIGETVHGSGSIMLGKEVDGTTANSSPPTDTYAAPFTFVQAYIQVPNGSTLAEIQEFDLTLNQNAAYNYGMNSQYPVSAYRQAMDITGKFNITLKDNTWLTNVQNRASLATATFVFDNGLAGTNQRKIFLEFTGVGLDTHSASYNPNELIVEELPLVMQDKTSIYALDNTPNPP